MKQKEERDLESALAADDMPGNLDAVLEAMKVDKEESEQFFKEAGQLLIQGEAALLDHRRKRLNDNLAKHWFVYEYPGRQEVRLLIIDQHIDGGKYSFMNGEDSPVFSYA
jgi:hypothetical protein